MTTTIKGWPDTGGSGPGAGAIGITDTSSVAALKNYFPKLGGVEFVYAPEHGKFAVGIVKSHARLDGSRHQQLAIAMGLDMSAVIVGGTMSRGINGEFLCSENSGHLGALWTPSIRAQFELWLSHRTGLPVIHHYWEKK